MANDLIALVLRANLALAAGIAVVLLLRAPARRWFGARIAYVLWLLPVLAAGACFLPPRIERLIIDEPLAPVSSTLAPLETSAPAITHLPPTVWLAIWCVGALLSVAVLALRQGRFARALGRLRPRDDLGAGVFGAESCTHGPAVIGVLRPIIVTPADFDQRFSDEERRIVLAHERAHLAQGDPLINAFVVVLQCASWFNPLVHLGARALRLDQELAADAAVLATSARRPYAEAILKTQIMASAPLSAAWPPNSTQSLKERISMLKRTLPSRSQRLIGVSSVALAAFGVCAAAWAAQPAHVIITTAPHIARADAAPFIEPPVNDASMLVSAPQAVTQPTKLDARSDESADDTADDPDAADAETDAEASNHIVIHQTGRLSPQQRAEIQAHVRAAIAEGQAAARIAQSQAIAQSRAAAEQGRAAAAEARAATREAQSEAMAESRAAAEQGRAAAAEAREAARVAQSEAVREAMAEGRAAAAEARIAAREAQAEAVRASVAAAREVNSPRVQAEIRAIAAQAAQLARTQAHLTAEQRDEMRAEIRARAAHLRTMTHNASCPPDQDDQDNDDGQGD